MHRASTSWSLGEIITPQSEKFVTPKSASNAVFRVFDVILRSDVFQVILDRVFSLSDSVDEPVVVLDRFLFSFDLALSSSGYGGVVVVRLHWV